MRMGLVEQDANTGRYDLGEFSLELGLASLARLDPVRLAGPVLDDLCEQIGATVALAMWGNHGATCVRWVEAGGAVTVTLRTGVVLPLTTSATGLAFSAFYRSPYLKKMLDAEVQATAEASGKTPAAVMAALTQQLEDIRRNGVARAAGSMTIGINGVSAPVFGHTGRMVAAVTSLGIVGSFGVELDSSVAQGTREAAATLSRRLGYGSSDGAAGEHAAALPARVVRRPLTSVPGGCRAGCGACCIAPSITTPMPGHPEGKPAGERCANLTDDLRCRLWDRPERPACCAGCSRPGKCAARIGNRRSPGCRHWSGQLDP
jgi:DNA-binding IclR family transcriptional regulator